MKITVTIDTEGRESEFDGPEDITDSLMDVEDAIRDRFDGFDGEDVNLTITFDGQRYHNGELHNG